MAAAAGGGDEFFGLREITLAEPEQKARLPLILGPPEGSSMDAKALAEHLRANKVAALAAMLRYGAVLFRGFDIASPEDFADALAGLELVSMPYVGGAAVRTNVVGDVVFTANESPPSEPIPFHHEMAQVPEPPTHLLFWCDTAPSEGGETPLIRSNDVYNFFHENHPEFCAKVEELGVKYVRVMPEEDDPTSAIGRSWKSTFLCDTREEAEKKMAELGTEFEWLEGGNLKTTTATVPAIRLDKRTGTKMFFNSVVAAFTGWIDSRNDPTKAVLLGDGSAVDTKALNDVAEFMMKARVCTRWQKGDMAILDNGVVMHSRNPFKPPRRILASIGRGVKASSITLATGRKMPLVGIGFWKVPKDVAPDTVYEAIRAGYRHLDNACDYGNEKEVGVGIKRAIDDGLVTREELFVVSKLWNTYHGKEHVRAACEKTLADLGLDYVDLYHIHFPIALKFVPFETRYPPEWSHDPEVDARMEFSGVPIHETWAAMEELVDAGLVKDIGICNMTTSAIRDLLGYARIRPSVLQVELHPYLTQRKLIRYCESEGIHVTGFSPLGSGSYGLFGEGDSALKEPKILEIAERVHRSPAQVILRWGVQRGTSVIPKSTKLHRMKENLALFDFTLSDADMETLYKLDKNRRFNDPGVFCEAAFKTFCPIYE